MNSTLKRYKLRQLIEVTRGQSLSGEYYAEQGDTIRLTLANFDYQNGGFKEDLQKADIYYTGPIKPHCLLNEGDIITPLTEQTPGLLGSTARIPESGKYVQSGDVALIKCNEELIDPSFCYYLLPSSQVKKQLAVGSQQTKIRHTSPDAIKNCIVDIPDIEQQRKIGKLLDSITAKIDENRKQNVILEKMSKQLYDYWFVQFDFPDENGRPYKSSGGKMVWNETLKREIPEGWEVKPIFDELDITYGYPFSTDLFTDVPTNKPLIRIRDILEGTISAYTTEEVSDKYRLQEGDVLVGMDGNFHMNYWHNNTTYLNQRCVRLRPRHDSNITSIQIFYGIQPYIKAKEKTTKGSTVGHLSDKDMKGLFILKANDSTQADERKCELDNLLKKTISNRKEMLQLQSIRSYLLPLLMTGQAKLK
jgi:type I restriction enzyme S subunit